MGSPAGARRCRRSRGYSVGARAGVATARRRQPHDVEDAALRAPAGRAHAPALRGGDRRARRRARPRGGPLRVGGGAAPAGGRAAGARARRGPRGGLLRLRPLPPRRAPGGALAHPRARDAGRAVPVPLARRVALGELQRAHARPAVQLRQLDPGDAVPARLPPAHGCADRPARADQHRGRRRPEPARDRRRHGDRRGRDARLPLRRARPPRHRAGPHRAERDRRAHGGGVPRLHDWRRRGDLRGLRPLEGDEGRAGRDSGRACPRGGWGGGTGRAGRRRARRRPPASREDQALTSPDRSASAPCSSAAPRSGRACAGRRACAPPCSTDRRPGPGAASPWGRPRAP